MYTEWRAFFIRNERVFIYKATSSCYSDAIDKKACPRRVLVIKRPLAISGGNESLLELERHIFLITLSCVCFQQSNSDWQHCDHKAWPVTTTSMGCIRCPLASNCICCSFESILICAYYLCALWSEKTLPKGLRLPQWVPASGDPSRNLSCRPEVIKT